MISIRKIKHFFIQYAICIKLTHPSNIQLTFLINLLDLELLVGSIAKSIPQLIKKNQAEEYYSVRHIWEEIYQRISNLSEDNLCVF